MRDRLHSALLILMLLASFTAHADMQIYTIPLKHTPAENLIPTLSPLIPDGGYLTSHGNNIIVRTNAENLAELQLLIDELDRPLAQVLISVRRGSQFDSGQTQLKVNGEYIGDNGGIVIGKRHSDGTISNSTTVITRRTTGIGHSDNSYQIRGLEGRPSYINSGDEVPLTSVQTGPYGRPYINREYKSLERGFYATPRLYGDRVTIDISTRYDRVDPANSDRIKTESVDTSVSGRLGEWIAIGNLDHTDNRKEQGLSHYRSTRELSAQTIYLKVERVN